MNSGDHFDSTVRCEVTVSGRAADAEQAFEACGWQYRSIGAGDYHVDVRLRGSPVGGQDRAREEFLTAMRRYGVPVVLRKVYALRVQTQPGDRLRVYRKVHGRWPRLENLLVQMGLRDTRDLLQAASKREADFLVVLLADKIPGDSELGWRYRFGQPAFPEDAQEAKPASRAMLIALAVGAWLTGLLVGLFRAHPGTLVLATVTVPALAYGVARAQRAAKWALAAVVATAVGAAMGLATEPDRWYGWPVAVVMVFVGTGLQHLYRDLSLSERASWLLPLILPLLVPITAYVGDLAYQSYLEPIGLSRGSVALSLLDRLNAAVIPVSASVVVSFAVLSLFGWLRYWHVPVPMSAAVLVVVAYVATGIGFAADSGADAAHRPERGFAALHPFWACAEPVAKDVATQGARLPQPARPLLYLELADGQIALWDAQAGWRAGLVKAPAGQIRIRRVAGRSATCR